MGGDVDGRIEYESLRRNADDIRRESVHGPEREAGDREDDLAVQQDRERRHGDAQAREPVFPVRISDRPERHDRAVSDGSRPCGGRDHQRQRERRDVARHHRLGACRGCIAGRSGTSEASHVER